MWLSVAHVAKLTRSLRQPGFFSRYLLLLAIGEAAFFGAAFFVATFFFADFLGAAFFGAFFFVATFFFASSFSVAVLTFCAQRAGVLANCIRLKAWAVPRPRRRSGTRSKLRFGKYLGDFAETS